MSDIQIITQLREQLDTSRLPHHVAIIMDGNGRWAKERGKPRIEGHRAGVKAVRAAVEASAELRLSALTLYAFSSENWRRPVMEIKALMKLLIEYLRREIDELHENNIRLNIIGRVEKLPEDVQEQLLFSVERTKYNSGLVLTIALNYGGRNEILDAIKKVYYDIQKKQLSVDALTPEVFGTYLSTADLPELDLMIRTSGEMRISNFLLWQVAYAELYVTRVLWPDFGKQQFYEALMDYQQRSRRFGRIDTESAEL
jgi:undecaprenyl diphosphate synthase